MPNVKIVVSTTTTTGMAELQKRLPARVGKIYYPIDRRRYVTKALSMLHPDAMILTESEIWPNFLWRAQALKTPLFLVNARLSDRSYPRYKRFGFIFRDLFAGFLAVGAQNEQDAAKLRELGCREEAVHVVGNLKFDAALSKNLSTLDVPALLKTLGIAEDSQILVAGSTHAGEEVMLAKAYLRLRQRFPKLILIIVPRHAERAREIAGELRKAGLHPFLRSEFNPSAPLNPGHVKCLLVDSTGELRSFYQCATVAFVGKSFTAIGGQNPIEPAALGKPTIFGPNMQNFADVTRILLNGRGAMQMKDASQLEPTIASLLENPSRCEELGTNARRIVQENQGAVNRTVEMIIRHLDNGGIYIAPPKPDN